MKAGNRRLRSFVDAGREPCATCGRGYRFRTVRKLPPAERFLNAAGQLVKKIGACRYCEAIARPAPRVDFTAFMKGIRQRVLAAGAFRNVIAFNRRWNVRFSRADGWKPTPPAARAA